VDTSAEGRSADRAGRRDPPLPDYIRKNRGYRVFNAASAATLIIHHSSLIKEPDKLKFELAS
jgi:hypothetical protein